MSSPFAPGCEVRLPQYPWETTNVTALALGSQPLAPWLWEPPIPALPPLPKQNAANKEKIVELAPKRRKLYQSIVDANHDDQRAGELHKWLELVEVAIDNSLVGRQILADQVNNNGVNVDQIIRDSCKQGDRHALLQILRALHVPALVCHGVLLRRQPLPRL